MPMFEYTARAPSGQIQKGQLEVASKDEVSAYLQRWSLVSSERAAQQIRFLTHPLWRAYISTYVEGFDLLSRWLDDRPSDQSVAHRFVRLLDEPLTPRAVAAELLAV